MAVSDSSGSSKGCFLGVLQVSPIIFDGLSFPSGGVGVSAWTKGLGIMVKVSDLMEVGYLAIAANAGESRKKWPIWRNNLNLQVKNKVDTSLYAFYLISVTNYYCQL